MDENQETTRRPTPERGKTRSVADLYLAGAVTGAGVHDRQDRRRRRRGKGQGRLEGRCPKIELPPGTEK